MMGAKVLEAMWFMFQVVFMVWTYCIVDHMVVMAHDVWDWVMPPHNAGLDTTSRGSSGTDNVVSMEGVGSPKEEVLETPTRVLAPNPKRARDNWLLSSTLAPLVGRTCCVVIDDACPDIIMSWKHGRRTGSSASASCTYAHKNKRLDISKTNERGVTHLQPTPSSMMQNSCSTYLGIVMLCAGWERLGMLWLLQCNPVLPHPQWAPSIRGGLTIGQMYAPPPRAPALRE